MDPARDRALGRGLVRLRGALDPPARARARREPAAFATMLASFLPASRSAARSPRASPRTRRARARSASPLAQLGDRARPRGSRFARRRSAARAARCARRVGSNALAPAGAARAAVLLPLTLCIGATFPFAVRVLARDASDADRRERARLRVEYGRLDRRCARHRLSSCCRGSASRARSLARRARTSRSRSARACSGGPRVACSPPPPSRLRSRWRSSRPRRPSAAARVAARRRLRAEPLTYFAVGRSRTVALIDQGMGWRLTTNGLPESAIDPPDYPAERTAAHWLAILPALVRPETARC